MITLTILHDEVRGKEHVRERQVSLGDLLKVLVKALHDGSDHAVTEAVGGGGELVDDAGVDAAVVPFILPDIPREPRSHQSGEELFVRYHLEERVIT